MGWLFLAVDWRLGRSACECFHVLICCHKWCCFPCPVFQKHPVTVSSDQSKRGSWPHGSPKTKVFSKRVTHFKLFPWVNGNFRTLKWRYHVSLHIYFVGKSPYIGPIYGRYLQFRYLKWPLMSSNTPKKHIKWVCLKIWYPMVPQNSIFKAVSGTVYPIFSQTLG
jgi:hypothetical protein